jgi:hypothetical protein
LRWCPQRLGDDRTRIFGDYCSFTGTAAMTTSYRCRNTLHSHTRNSIWSFARPGLALWHDLDGNRNVSASARRRWETKKILPRLRQDTLPAEEEATATISNCTVWRRDGTRDEGKSSSNNEISEKRTSTTKDYRHVLIVQLVAADLYRIHRRVDVCAGVEPMWRLNL